LDGLVEIYEALYGRSCRVEVDKSPSVILWDEGGVAVYGFSYLGPVVFRWVGCEDLEVVVVYEGLYFCVVLLGG
jgi:hypothetical protein